MENNYRQGDVILSKLSDSLPKRLKKKVKKKDGTILAWGEVTGHKHQVIGNDIQLYECEDGQTYLYVGSDTAKIVHEEHDPNGSTSVIEKGFYKYDIQQQYEPQGWKRVID